MKKIFILLLVPYVFLAQGNWKVEIQKTGETKGTGDERAILFNVMNPSGEKIYSISKSIVDESHLPSAGVFDSGNLLLASIYDGSIEFFSNNGDQINKIKLIDKVNKEKDVIIKYDINESTAAVLLSGNENYTKFYLFNKTGNIIYKENLDDKSANGIVNSDKYVAAGTSTWGIDSFLEHTTFFDSDGNQLGKINLSFTKGKFSESGKFIGFTTSNIFAAEIENTEVLWNVELEPDRTIADAEWKGDKVVLLTSALPVLKDGRWFYHNFEINELSKKGKIVKKKSLPEAIVESPGIVKEKNYLKVNLDHIEVTID